MPCPIIWRMKLAKNFKWLPDDPPPTIESHSKAKLDVLRNYLRAYFDRLNVNFAQEEFKLDLVDGFAGGGTFSDNGSIISGTPLIMLEEASAATERLNRNRVKPLRIDCKFYFVDKEKAHTDHLRKALSDNGHCVDDDRIVLWTSPFEDIVESIIDSVKQRQPRAHRAIFLLDQTGFSQVQLSVISRIFQNLKSAEVILTFAADTLVNYLENTPQKIEMVSPLQLQNWQIESLIASRGGAGGRALVQRTLRDQIRSVTGAPYDTPFFIKPQQSRRALWFLHLSKHSTARDVMVQQHWNIQNTFEHYGSGGFGMLGWDALKDSENLSLFQFDDFDNQHLRQHLLEILPGELHSLAAEQPVTVDAIHHVLANQTAARFSDLDDVIVKLVQEGEIEILDAEGKIRSRSLKRLRLTDRIAMPSAPLIPGLLRRR